MSDHFEFEPWKSVQSDSGRWYESVELLGVGRNAVAFLVHGTSSENLGLFYAMKIFRRISTPEAREKFLQESTLLKTLSHPTIMRIHDQGTYYGRHPFIIADYLPKTLRHVMTSGVSLVDKISYALQLTAAAKYINELNPPVIHRDIKPENIFISGRTCVLGDFGLMKRGEDEDAFDREIVKTTTGPGMPLKYRTPELIQYYKGIATKLGRSDVFQLGLTLAELFTSKNPLFEASDYGEPLRMEKISRIDGNLGAALAGILKRMLAEKPEDRPDWGWLLNAWRTNFHDAVDASHRFGSAFQ